MQKRRGFISSLGILLSGIGISGCTKKEDPTSSDPIHLHVDNRDNTTYALKVALLKNGEITKSSTKKAHADFGFTSPDFITDEGSYTVKATTMGGDEKTFDWNVTGYEHDLTIVIENGDIKIGKTDCKPDCWEISEK